MKRSFGGQIIRKPGSVLASYLSRLTVASELKRFDRCASDGTTHMRHISLQ